MSYIGQELGQGRASRETFTASGGETSVNTNYTPGQLSVYLNGSKLVDTIDYTATNGTSITGLTALAASDVMDFVALENFLVSNTVEATGGTFLGVVTLPSPVFTGVPATPTASAATNTTQVASTAFVRTEVSNLVDSAPSTLDTLNELAAALGDDAAFSTTVTNSIALKAPIASPTFTGNVVVPNINGTEIVTPATNNLGVGIDALDSITTGDYNTALGDGALTATEDGQQNLAIGRNALAANVGGHYNIAVGDMALVTSVSGTSNVAIGKGSLGLVSTGSHNTAIGEASLYATTGSSNVGIGKEAGNNITSGSSNIIIGPSVSAVSATASNQLNIGNTIYGDLSTKRVGIGKTVPAQLLHLYGAVPSMLFEDSTNGNLAYLGDAVDFLTSGAVADSFGIRSEGNLLFGTGGNNTRMTIDTSGNIGIGITAPDSKMHIRYGDVIASNTNTGLTVEGSVNEATQESGINILSTVGGNIFFGDAASAVIGRITYNHTDNDMAFYTNNAEHLTIDSSGKVGIGTSAPLAKIHSWTASGGGAVSYNAGADELALENSGDCGMTIMSGATNNGGIWFGKTGDNGKGRIDFDQNDGKMSLWTANTERLSILTAGNVGIGITAPDSNLHVMRSSAGSVSATAEAVLAIESSDVNETSLDILSLNTARGAIRFLSSGGTSIGSILYFHASDSVADQMWFTTLNTPRLVIDGAGFVGIGETAPASLLHIKGANAKLTIQASATDPAYLQFLPDNGANTSEWLITANKDSPYSLQFGRTSSNTTTLSLKGTNGNVGIGIADPAAKLHLYDGKMWMASSSASGYECWMEGTGGGHLYFGINIQSTTVPIMILHNNGSLIPGADNTRNLGASGARWANIYSADLQLSNTGTEGNEVDGTEGSWTLQEGDENLFVINRITGKKFKINLTEV